MIAHVIDPTAVGPFDRCLNCGQAIQDDAYGRRLIAMVSGNVDGYGKKES